MALIELKMLSLMSCLRVPLAFKISTKYCEKQREQSMMLYLRICINKLEPGCLWLDMPSIKCVLIRRCFHCWHLSKCYYQPETAQNTYWLRAWWFSALQPRLSVNMTVYVHGSGHTVQRDGVLPQHSQIQRQLCWSQVIWSENGISKLNVH